MGRIPASDQRRFWDAQYALDPEFFGHRSSAFARWAYREMGDPTAPARLLELGCGYGRDSRFFASRGLRVTGIDVADRGIELAKAETESGRLRPMYIEAEALDFLRRLPPAGIDIVYSNLFLNMAFSERDHRAIFRAVRRALRPGGYHAYSVRSTHDPWYGKGRSEGPDQFRMPHQAVSMHFFSRDYADRLAESTGLRAVRRAEVRLGGAEFPIRVLYVLDRSPRRPDLDGSGSTRR